MPIAGKLALFTVILALISVPCFAACHAVTPAGSGTKSGADWNNAYAKLPTTLTRGDTYYLADGSYGRYTMSTSGSTQVIIKKATAADNCTGTGWNASTMGSGQAVFSGIVASSSSGNGNFTFDGNGTSSAPGCGTANGGATSDCGIKIDNSTCTSSSADACDSPILLSVYNGTASTGVVFRYMEWAGNNNNNSERNFMYAPQTAGSSFTLDHVFGHDTGCVYIQQYGGTHTVKNSYFWKNYSSSGGCHGQYAYYSGNVSNFSEFNNVYRDIEGTAVFTFGSNTNSSNVQIYNNVFWYSNPPLRTGTGDGIVTCINSSSCTNFTVAQNVIANVQGSYDTGIQVIDGATSSGWIVENNIWYGNKVNIALNFSGTEDYNAFLNNSSNPGGGSHDTKSTSAPVPFVNWASGNFNLASQNSLWSNGASLASTYAVDVAGNSRPGTDGVWNRGAYEYANGQAQAPNPPTNLVANVQ